MNLVLITVEQTAMKSASALVTAVILSVFAAGTQLTGQELSQERLAFTNLTLDIAATKNEFVPLEPIPIVVTLRNSTAKTIAWRYALSPNHVELFAVSSAGSPTKLEIQKALRELIEVSPHPKVLKPGDVEHFKPFITMGLNDALSRPGDYQILAVAHGANWNEEVRSKPLSVRIVQPQGVNEQVFNYIKRTTSSDIFAGWDLSGNQGMASALEAVANEFVDLAYSDYASFRLGEFYFYKDENARAKIYLDRLAGRRDFVFAAKVADYRNKLGQRNTTKQ